MFLINRQLVVNKNKLRAMVVNQWTGKSRRPMSTSTSDTNNDNNDDGGVRKSVFISQSTDVYTNLALESWFHRNSTFRKNHVLLIWKNDPCVVVGRDRNPWLEISSPSFEDSGIVLARSNTAGGIIYHHADNLNMSFFTDTTYHDKHNNLQMIRRALARKFGIKSADAADDDAENVKLTENLEIFGSTDKIGQSSAYHHCTLFIDPKKRREMSHGKKNQEEEETRKSQLEYQIESSVSRDTLLSAIGWEYLRTGGTTGKDLGPKLIQRQRGFQMVNPTEAWFPGLDVLRNEFKSWHWNYGQTPRFTVTRGLKFPNDSTNETLNLTLDVENGVVVDIKLSLPSNFMESERDQDASVITNLRGSKYVHDFPDKIIAALGCTSSPVSLGVSRAVDKNCNVAATQ